VSTNPYDSPKSPPPHQAYPNSAESISPQVTGTVSTHHPPAFWFIFWGEFAERASYYGMRAILPLYLVEVLHFSEQDGASVYSGFKMAVYFLPLVGGFLSDRYIGKYWGIVGFSIPYVMGHFILGIENIPAMIIALTLLAIGSGVTKPNISALLGLTYDQQRPGQERLLSAAFRWFYMSINIGALISQFVMPVLRTNFSYRAAFQFPAWLMVGALIAFAMGKPYYAVEKPGPVSLTPEERHQRWETLKTLFGFFGLVVFFWFGYEHNDSLWVYFADKHMNLTIDWLGLTVRGDQFQWINALCVILFVPTISILASVLDKQQRIFTAYNRVLVGFVVTTISIAIMSAAGFIAQGETKVSVLWIIIAYVLLTLGEVLVYSTGLELSYTAAPKNMKAFITACFLVTNTLANFINILFAKWYDTVLSPGVFFGVTAIVTFLATIAFFFVGRRLARQQAQARSASVAN
jgi:POT family proton-dependent oligopeptide transporter